MKRLFKKELLSKEEVTYLLQKNKSKFYIYILCHNRYPFYVGKGQNGRIFDHEKYSMQGKTERDKKIKKAILSEHLEYYIKFTYSETKAYNLEKELTLKYGFIWDKGQLYNLVIGGSGGSSPSPSTRKKMSNAKLGLKRGRMPEKTKEKIRAANLGQKRSEETKERLRQSKLGTVQSKETKEKRGKALKGRVFSEEWLQKIRLSREGYKVSEETKEKLRAANLGKKASKETKEKMSNSHLGKKASKETKKRISKGNKYRCQGMIKNTIYTLISLKLRITEENFNEIKSKSCPKYENISKFFGKKELSRLKYNIRKELI